MPATGTAGQVWTPGCCVSLSFPHLLQAATVVATGGAGARRIRGILVTAAPAKFVSLWASFFLVMFSGFLFVASAGQFAAPNGLKQCDGNDVCAANYDSADSRCARR